MRRIVTIAVIAALMVVALPALAFGQADPATAGDSDLGTEIAWMLGMLIVGIVIGFGIAIGIREQKLGVAQTRRGRDQSIEEALEQQREIVHRW